jgi:alpha-L-arabinofuranosidase
VYVGEYASWGNTLFNALCEASYMTALERNGDVVRMASYAPLLANQSHTSWNPDLIYFNNTAVAPTANYYVQQMFSANSGDAYYFNVVSFPGKTETDSLLAASCVKDSKTGDVIVKIVNAGANNTVAKIDLSRFGKLQSNATSIVLKGNKDGKNTFTEPNNIIPSTSDILVRKNFAYNAPAYPLTVIRCHSKK